MYLRINWRAVVVILLGYALIVLVGCAERSASAISSARIFVNLCDESTIRTTSTRNSQDTSTFTITCESGR